MFNELLKIVAGDDSISIENEDESYAYFSHVSGLGTKVPKELHGDPQQVAEVIAGERDPEVLHHLTRVVGYYSRVSNWNESKKGELNDRKKGNYAV